jgi:hypothetical protein
MWRARTHDGKARGEAPLPRPTDRVREISITFHPMTDTTLATVLVRSRNGDTRWDRRDGVIQCELPACALDGLTPELALRVLLRSALESLG